MSKLVFCFLILLFAGCNQSTYKNIIDENPTWALAMADASISRFDSLIRYNNPTRVKWEYDFAFLGLAIDRLGSIDQKYSKYMQDYIDYFVDSEGNIKSYKKSDYNIDRVNPGKNLIVLYKRTGEEKYKIALETLVSQMESHPKNSMDGFWHKKQYPNQMWLDGIYMGAPFLAQYAREFAKPDWNDIIANQILLIYEKTYDPKTGLLYHAWDESKSERWCNPETGQSKHFWSRAMGWYLMAIVDVLDYFPEKHKDRALIVERFQKACEALLKVRDKESKLWYQVLDKKGATGNYLEASGSAMYIYAFAKGFKNGYLNKKYMDIANESFDGLVKNLVVKGEDGYPVLKNVCGGCGLGGTPYREGDYNYYITEKIVDNDPKGVAPFILASIELNK